MKVLYIGHYKEFGGWSQAATDYILALDKNGVDVVCRNVTLTSDKEDVDSRLLALEKKDSSDCDVCIQHVLPHHLVKYNKLKKNIAFFASESTSIKGLAWLENLKMMDEVWVPNEQLKNSLIEDKVGIPVKVIPHTFELEKYKRRYGDIKVPNAEGKFKFYYVGDVNKRKNLESILACFYSEFESSEDVALILKVSKFGHDPKMMEELVNNLSTKVQKDVRLYRNSTDYKRPIIVPSKIKEEELYALHQYCDCFICPSHGEAWSIPSFEAMCFGNTPICSNFGGPRDFIDRNDWRTGFLVNGVSTICRCDDAAFPDLFTGREYWFQPSEKDIKEQMRRLYNSWKKDSISYKSRNQAAGLKRAEQFSYKNIAELMKEAINE